MSYRCCDAGRTQSPAGGIAAGRDQRVVVRAVSPHRCGEAGDDRRLVRRSSA